MASTMSRYDLEDKEQWREWVDKIPFVKFDEDWQVKVIPPFAGAIARFLVRKGHKQVSVYLDVFDALGFMNKQPYWEVYPIGEEPERFMLEEEREMLEAIRNQLNEVSNG